MPNYLLSFILAIAVTLLLVASCEEVDTTPPEVTIITPNAGSSVSEEVGVTCVASDNEGVEMVELWVDAVKTEIVDESEPYSLTWNTTQYEDGSTHTISVRAYDNSDNVGDSDPVNVTIDQSEAKPTPAIFYPTEIGPESYTVRWTKNSEDDFLEYGLFESTQDDMSGATLVYTSESVSDTTYTATNLSLGQSRYYHLITTDQWGLSSTSDIGIVSFQRRFTQTFGGSSDDGAHHIQTTSDGGYLLVGVTESYGNGWMDAWIIKTDADGTHIWSKTFGGTSVDMAYSSQSTTDEGFIITGKIDQDWTPHSEDVWLAKLSSNGDTEWEKSFGGLYSHEYGKSVLQTDDGGYVVGAWTMEGGFWLIKTNSVGEAVWDSVYTDFGGSGSPDILKSVNGGYILLSDQSNDAFLCKIDVAGDIQWSRTFGGSEYDQAIALTSTSDGGYVICGSTESFGAGGADAWLIKTDADGIEEWTRTFGGSENDWGMTVIQAADGGYVVTGYTASFGAGGNDGWLIKTDADGIEEWIQTYGGEDMDGCSSVAQGTNDGYVLTGGTQSFGNSSSDIWLIKTDYLGNTILPE